MIICANPLFHPGYHAWMSPCHSGLTDGLAQDGYFFLESHIHLVVSTTQLPVDFQG